MAAHARTPASRRRRFSLTGALLLALGIVLLLNTTGLVSERIWPELLRYWPVLLVLLGVSLLLGRPWPLVCAGVSALILAATVGAASLTMTTRQADDGDMRMAYAAPPENAETLRLGMGFTGGSVTVSAYPDGVSDTSGLFAADFNGNPAEVIRDSPDRFYLSTGRWGSQVGIVDWDLAVSRDVAVDIEIKAGAADLDLDLRDLNVRSLVIGAGAADIRISLPAGAGQTRVEISAGAADIEIAVPDGVAARVYNNSVLGATKTNTDSFFPGSQTYGVYDYETAENRVDIEIDGVATDVTVD